MKQHVYTQVTLLRHGARYVSTAKRHYTDPSLTKQGKAQAAITAEYLRNHKFDRIYVSDHRRSLETAQYIEKYQRAKLIVCPELREVNHIVYKKKPADKRKLQEQSRKMRKAIAFFRRILRENRGKRILLVIHGNVIRVLIKTSMGLPIEEFPYFHTHHCSLTVLSFQGTKLHAVHALNVTDHHTKTKHEDRFRPSWP